MSDKKAYQSLEARVKQLEDQVKRLTVALFRTDLLSQALLESLDEEGQEIVDELVEEIRERAELQINAASRLN